MVLLINLLSYIIQGLNRLEFYGFCKSILSFFFFARISVCAFYSNVYLIPRILFI